ncbi:DoxX family protein [Pseudooceanicola sp. CBS1P-1]|uniref:DoxX family membrane protein n=1 Tax=Pseudooceanicola albus TaxID=2692189 RepID=A0A6L7G2J7_9RHOB|nr:MULTISPECIES: DoxX family protein [Pseudooceanicola]MBT9384614.1 DoxX family protein [Pseudooceanicola endophyticus]MXN18315.1 DoxX family membrane protein [Pseudooceanicola albus]
MKILDLYRAAALPGGRILASIIFIVAGYGKIVAYSGSAGYMQAMGVPGALLPLVILTELGGGLALLLGWQTRTVAFLLAGFSVISALIFHLPGWMAGGDGASAQQINFLKNMTMAGGLGYISVFGAGPFSIDGLLGRDSTKA